MAQRVSRLRNYDELMAHPSESDHARDDHSLPPASTADGHEEVNHYFASSHNPEHSPCDGSREDEDRSEQLAYSMQLEAMRKNGRGE